MSVVNAPLPVSVSLQGKCVNWVGSNDGHDRLLRLVNDCVDISQLKEIHARALRTTSPHDARGLFIRSRILYAWSLVDAEYACHVFGQVPEPNAFMWNTLIRSFALSQDRKEEAITAFQKMMEEGRVTPDKHTFPFVLKACAYLFALEEGKQLQATVFKLGFDRDVYVNNSLIHFYASCGRLKSSRDVFERMSSRSVVSWNAMIGALAEHGEFDSSLLLFREMQESFKPDGYTLQGVLNACAGLGSLSLGMWTHLYLLKHFKADVIDDVLVNSSLVEMYCKSGSMELAEEVFRRMPRHSVHSWNSMILGFAMHGRAEAAISYFSDMTTREGVVPNSVTFVGVLSACNHRGLVDEGRKYFNTLIRDYNIDPLIEHYGCLVDLLARAGLIEEALDLVSNMSMKPDTIIWRSLLDACSKKNASVELSEDMAEQVLESEGEACSGVYVLLSRVYASARRWDDVGLIRKLMRERGIAKEPGCSSMEIDGVSHEFFAGDTSHPQTNAIYQALDKIDKKLYAAGYSPDASQVPMVEDEPGDKRNSLRLHSERLAIAFGLLNRKNGVPIRVFKNLRVCNDCHQVTKLISWVYDVEIIVRDRARFHHFKGGSCSCNDYW